MMPNDGLGIDAKQRRKKVIPTIETIVEDLMAGTITKQQAIWWLCQCAEDAGLTLRDDFAASVIGHLVCAEVRQDFTTEKDAAYAYDVADAMMAARKKAPNAEITGG